MKADPSSRVFPVEATREPTPLPPPPAFDHDDHYFDDDDQPSWWSTLRPFAPWRQHDPDAAAVPARDAAPARPRTITDEVCATAHVLRVRALLEPDEQRGFDELMRGPAATDIITMLVNRSERDALDNLRRRLADEPTAADASKRSLATQIAAVSALLSADEKATALASLASLWPEELHALHARMLALSPAEAAALVRTYLSPRRRGS